MLVKIESTSNSIFKNTKKLATHIGRKKSGLFVIEGFRSVNDAVKNGALVEYIIVCEDSQYTELFESQKVYMFSKKLFDELKFTVNSQGVLAVVKSPENTVSDLLKSTDFNKIQKAVYLDAVQDPGNLGTIVRTCDAMGVDALMLGEGCADLYNPKTVRSTMASIFNIPVYFDDLKEETFKKFNDAGFKIAGTFLSAEKYIYNADLTGRCLIVMGNEANGISPEVEGRCNLKVKIPMSGNAESLNVATACAMILYEQYRQNNC